MNVSALKPQLLASKSAVPSPRKPLELRMAVSATVAAALAIAIQALWLPIDADVSWLIIVCERILAGDRLYVDIVEVNPPASVWLYLPLVWFATLVGAKAEAVVVAAFVAAGLASVAAAVRLASRLDDTPPTRWLAPALAFIALVMPMALFAQREHAALILALPVLTVMAVIGESKSVGKWTLYASGFAAGLIIVIKPHFLPAVLAPAVWVAWRRRTVLPLVPGVAAATAAISLYAAALLLFAGAYFDWISVFAQTYAPMRKEAWKVVLGPSIFPAICLALAVLLRAPRIPSLAAVWALGSAGFVIAAMVQGKNYPNHHLPGAALGVAATLAILMLPRIESARRALVGAVLALFALWQLNSWAIEPDPALTAAVERVAPPRPKIIALSPQLTTGHPLTRNVGGWWIGSRASLFTAGWIHFAGLKDPLARQAYREDIDSFATDILRHSPDVVLVDAASKEWLMKEESIAGAMSSYRPVRRTRATEVWLRKTASAAAHRS